MGYADPRDANYIASANKAHAAALAADYTALGVQLQRRGIAIDDITRAVAGFHVAIPSWGVGTGGTRFGRFPGKGEPRNVFEKLEDCAVIHRLTGATPTVSLHLPWDRTDDFIALATEISGDSSVTPFLRDWLYGQKTPPMPGHPDWTVNPVGGI